jgi:WD40 repeat protein
MSGDGALVVTGSNDTTAILWDVATARPIQSFIGHGYSVNSVGLSGDCRRVLTGSADETAILWDATTGRRLRTFKGHTSIVSSVALSTDGESVLTGSWDGTAILCDAATAKPIRVFKGHRSEILSVALGNDTKRVLTGSEDKTAVLWDAASGKPKMEFKGHADEVTSVALSRDGKRVVTGSKDKTAIVWDAETGERIQTLKGHNEEIRSVALSGDGKHVVTGVGRRWPGSRSTETRAILWDVETGRQIQSFDGHTDTVSSVLLDDQGRRVLTGSYDRTAVLWDAQTGKVIQKFRGRTVSVNSIATSSDGRYVFAGSRFERPTLWDLQAATPVRNFVGHTNSVLSVAMSSDAKRALTGSYDQTAILWDTETGRPIRAFKGHSYAIKSVALSGDATRALTGSYDKTTTLWDAETGSPIQTFKGDGVDAVGLSADGKRVVTGDSKNKATSWDIETGKPLRTFGEKINVWCVAFAADSKRVLTGSGYDAVLWDAETAQSNQVFKGHTNWVKSVAMSASGKRALTGSYDQSAILWDAATARPIQVFKGHSGVVTGVAFAQGDSEVVTCSLDGTLMLWIEGRDQPVLSFLAVGEEWMFWTPEGYYTCSPNGENLIAWKIHDNSPHGYRIVGPEQFRKKFNRPDMFRHLLKELDLNRALAIADRESGRVAEAATTIAEALPPVALITSPRRNAEFDTEGVTVESIAASNGDYPVTRMRLLVDGRPFEGNLSTFKVPQPKLGQVEWSKRVDLEPGEHTIQVIAESAVSEGRSDVVHIRRKAIVETLPRLFVLAVGISAYDKEALRKDVYYAAGDARKFADTVERSSKPLYREVIAFRLIDQAATRGKILQSLAQMRKQATQRDVVLIFFAGHGARDDQANFYFLPVEADLDNLAATGLSEGDFKAQVKGLLPSRVVLLLDACHSGTLVESRGRGTDGLTDTLYRDLTSNEYGLVMMCSSKGQEVSKESQEHKSGFFTVAVVEGLEGKAVRTTEGVVYLKALDAYVTERVKELSEGAQHPLTSQDPTLTNIPLTRP